MFDKNQASPSVDLSDSTTPSSEQPQLHQNSNNPKVLLAFGLGVAVGALIVGAMALFMKDFPDRQLFTSPYEPPTARNYPAKSPEPEAGDVPLATRQPQQTPYISSQDQNETNDCVTTLYPKMYKPLEGWSVTAIDTVARQMPVRSVENTRVTSYVRWDNLPIVLDSECKEVPFLTIKTGDVVNIYALTDDTEVPKSFADTRIIQITSP